ENWPKKRAANPRIRGPKAWEQLLPSLGENERNRAPLVALQDVVGSRVTALSLDAVLEGRRLIHDVLDHQLDPDVLEVVVCRVVTAVIAKRKIEGVLRRLEVAVIVDRAGEGAARRRAARRDALEVHVRRRRLRVEEV